jgi:hypothetical protein
MADEPGTFTMQEITVMGQLPRSLSRAGKPFRTADEAAIAAIDEILPVSVTNNIEYSGAIVRSTINGFFQFTYADTQDDPTASDANPAIPAGTVRVGLYHTHGAGDGKTNAENFSPNDIIICIGQKTVLFYLGTPSKHIKKLIPPGLLTGDDKQKFGFFGKPVLLR